MLVTELSTISRYQDVLPIVMEGVSNTYGQDFFNAITTQLARCIGADFTFIGRVSEDQHSVTTVALCQADQIVDNISYVLLDTPCENVVDENTCIHKQDVCEKFPKDILLQNMDIEAYIGAPLYDRKHQVLGLVVGLYCAPLEQDEYVKSVFELFAGRIAAEIESSESAVKLQQLNEELEQRIEARTEELAIANEELTAFSHSVSHDLKAPVRAIRGFSEALLEDVGRDFPAEGIQYLQMIQDNACKMQFIIDDMLKLSKISLTDIHKEQLDLSALCVDILNDLQKHDAQRQVKLNIAEKLYIDADAGLCRLLFTNLLSNAWKYTGNTPQAEISVSESFEGNKHLIVIADNGAGFDMAVAGKLFSVFTRLHSSSEFEGSGIGLATCKRIVDKHGANIDYYAEVNNGAKFILSWPSGFH
ncbi:MAG: GHKL domain-containing protein [Pseudomonadales bacterium]|nr:GHKL domain-containing protein [Pseudomonadales bacterium]